MSYILYVLNCYSSDLWALGCIIYQLLSGHHPFWGRSVMFAMDVIYFFSLPVSGFIIDFERLVTEIKKPFSTKELILYQLHYCFCVFCSHEYQIFQKIVKLEYEFPDGFPTTAKDLVTKLLVFQSLFFIH